LPSHQKPSHGGFSVENSRFRVDDDRILDVGISSYAIWLSMMTRVPSNPPPVTNANQSIVDDMPENNACGSGTHDLAMSKIVTKKSEMSKQDGKQETNHHLPPRITQ
jgi:hypothetical protein